MDTAGTSPISPEQVASLLHASAAAIIADVEALTVAQCSWRPAPGEWCVNEVIGHIIEAERRGFAGRIRLIVAHDRPELETWDPPAVASARRDCERDTAALIEELRALRTDSIQLILSLTPEQLDRAGRHPAVDDLTVRDILHEWVTHDRNHLAQIFGNVKALTWPYMGNARRFSQPE
jgi:hypothetical protein